RHTDAYGDGLRDAERVAIADAIADGVANHIAGRVAVGCAIIAMKDRVVLRLFFDLRSTKRSSAIN
ncbi:MAG: hypothetical protein WBE78_14540, partial [Candidatus Binataceae bacterium]